MDKPSYNPAIKSRWQEESYADRNFNNEQRLLQYARDSEYIKQFIQGGTICDVGCGTGEFLQFMQWDGEKCGLEISDYAMQEAEKRDFNFNKNILNQDDYFDVVLFRGTIQHLDVPFYLIKRAYAALKPGGLIIFLATPNSESILYRLKGTLPALNPDKNFFIPGARELSNVLLNFDFNVIDLSYPYLDTPYASPVKDHMKFLLNLLTPMYFPHPFWQSMMNLVAKK
jgi:SAM-dependent methyltransferase